MATTRAWPAELDYDGPPCPNRCDSCPSEPEHHWEYDPGEIDGDELEDALYVCRHCDAQREIPTDTAFQDAFPAI